MIPFGNVQLQDCVNIPTPSDPRCSDPAFAISNPAICPVGPLLIIKPAVALTCALGSIQFRVFQISNGTEKDVTASTLFSSSDLGVAMVGAISGNATGVAAGEATISGTYQGATARAELTVLGTNNKCCDNISVAMELVVDNSRSMSQAFSTDYATKLSLAKAAATQFAGEINQIKDLVGLMRFNAVDDVVIDSPTHDKAQVALDATAIAQTQQSTSFYDALTTALSELNASGATRKILVLFSDGIDQTKSYNASNNPIDLLSDFKNTGGIVICFGIRATGKGYSLLSQFSTGGFFINAYGSNATASLAYLSGLKGYVCAGNCTPAGDVIENEGISNYTKFINWDVMQGTPDLLGNGFYDCLPGNGLYVDLRGSGNLNGNYTPPILQSKAGFHLLAGHVYRVALDLAGNQSVLRPADIVQLLVFSDSVTLLSQQIGMPDYTADFATHAFSFTAPADMTVKISIGQTNDTAHDLGGVMLGRVKFDDTTDLITMLDDNFDTENPTYVPPACGVGTYYSYFAGHYGYYIGYECYGTGCLDAPPGPQSQDPQPLTDIEAGFVPPIEYQSTKQACASCGATAMNLSAVNLIPAMTGPTTPSGAASASGEDAAYQAYGAFDGTKPIVGGIPHNSIWDLAGPAFPVWLRYDFPAAQTVAHYEITGFGNSSGFGAPPKDWIFQGSNDGATWTDLDTVAGATFFQGETKKYLVDAPAAYTSYRLYITAGKSSGYVAVVELAMFAAVDQSICKTASATSEVSQTAADTQAYNAALALAQAELNCTHLFSSTQQATVTCSYHLFPATASASATSLNSQAEADADALAAATVLATAARDCTQSTNDQQISITDYPGVAVPYPSVKYVSSSTPIALVTVSLTNLNQFFPVDIVCVLQAPNGTAVVLFAKAGNAPTVNVSMTFADAGATVAPAGGPLVNGATYKPGHNGAYLPLPAPGPAQPHQTTLASLIGSNPAGLWALWLLDSTSGQGVGTLASWDLNIS